MTVVSEAEIVTSDGGAISVEKATEAFNEEDFSSIAKVRFTIRSQADLPMSVTLVDTLPADWPAENVGFHPDHEPDQWSIADGVVKYTCELGPEEDHETLYAVRLDDRTDLERFHIPVDLEVEPLTSAEVEAGGSDLGVSQETAETAWDGPLNGSIGVEDAQPVALDDAGLDAGDDPWAEAVDHPDDLPSQIPASFLEDAGDELGDDPMDWSDDAGDAPALDPEPEPVSPLDEHIEMAEEPPFPETAGPTGDVDGGQPSDLSAAPFTRGASSDEEPTGMDLPVADDPIEEDWPGDAGIVDTLLEALRNDATEEQREALSEALGTAASSSLTARLDYLQRELGELSAYKDAIREFIDEEGSAKETIDDVQDELARVHAEVRDQREQLEAVDARVDQVAELGEHIDDIEDRFDRRLSRFSVQLEESQETLEEVDSLRNRVQRLDSRFDAGLDDIESTLSEVVDDHESDFRTIRAEIRAMRDTLDETRTWQEAVQDTFAGLDE